MDSQSNSTPVPTVQIGGVETQQITYRGQVVVTFAQIDAIHQRPEDTARRTFNENKGRFVEGEDFHRLTSDEIRTMSQLGVLPARTARAVVLTEQGYLILTKPMNDDRAWQVQREMVGVYFAVRDGKVQVGQLPLPRKLKEVGDVMAGFSRLAGLLGLKGNQRALSAAMATYRETGVDVLQLTGVTHLDSDVQQKNVTPTVIGARVTPPQTAARVNQILAELGLQTKEPYPTKDGMKHSWELTLAGEATGARYADTTKRHSNGTPVKTINWGTSVVAMVQAHIGEQPQ